MLNCNSRKNSQSSDRADVFSRATNDAPPVANDAPLLHRCTGRRDALHHPPRRAPRPPATGVERPRPPPAGHAALAARRAPGRAPRQVALRPAARAPADGHLLQPVHPLRPNGERHRGAARGLAARRPPRVVGDAHLHRARLVRGHGLHVAPRLPRAVVRFDASRASSRRPAGRYLNPADLMCVSPRVDLKYKPLRDVRFERGPAYPGGCVEVGCTEERVATIALELADHPLVRERGTAPRRPGACAPGAGPGPGRAARLSRSRTLHPPAPAAVGVLQMPYDEFTARK